MKGKSRRTLVRHEVSDFGKVDRAVQKSYRKEMTIKSKSDNYGVWNRVYSAIKKFFKYIFAIGGNHYKTHIPKSMRKGLTNSQIIKLRKRIHASGKRYV